MVTRMKDKDDKEFYYTAQCAYCDKKMPTEKGMNLHLMRKHNVPKNEIKVTETNVLEISNFME